MLANTKQQEIFDNLKVGDTVYSLHGAFEARVISITLSGNLYVNKFSENKNHWCKSRQLFDASSVWYKGIGDDMKAVEDRKELEEFVEILKTKNEDGEKFVNAHCLASKITLDDIKSILYCAICEFILDPGDYMVESTKNKLITSINNIKPGLADYLMEKENVAYKD